MARRGRYSSSQTHFAVPRYLSRTTAAGDLEFDELMLSVQDEVCREVYPDRVATPLEAIVLLDAIARSACARLDVQIHTLIHTRQASPTELAAALGMSRQAIMKRMWQVEEGSAEI